MALTILDTLVDGTQVTRVTGDVSVTVLPSTSGSITQVASSTLSVELLPIQPARKGFTLYNDSSRIAYVAFGEAASTVNFSVKMPGGSFYELASLNYTGTVTAAWNIANGTMQVTSIT